MLTQSLSSRELFKSENFVPRALDEESELHHTNSRLSLRLTRNTTHLSEISRIILGIRDDRGLDAEQYASYQGNMEPEANLVRQLNSAPDGIIEDENKELPKDGDGKESLESETDHTLDGPFAFCRLLSFLQTYPFLLLQLLVLRSYHEFDKLLICSLKHHS